MSTQKRISVLVLFLALVVPILAACGGGTTTSPTAATGGEPTAATAAEPTAATAAEPTAATAAEPTAMASGGAMMEVEDGAVLRVSSWGNPAEQKVNTDSFARFNAIYPNVKITYEPQPDNFQTKIKADFAGSTEPDVFYLDSSLMTALAPEGLLLPLDDAMQAGSVKADDYVGELVSLFQADGKTYALPKDQGSLALFVNNDIAQKAGVDPASLKTWDDVTAAAKKMTSGEGPAKVYGMCSNADSQRGTAFILQTGNPIIENGKAVFNQDNAVKAVEWWASFKKDGSGELFKELGAGWCGEAFAKNRVGMVIEGGWMLPFLADPNNGAESLKYTALPLPTPADGQQATLVFTNGWAASARTKYPKAAAALVLYLTSAANQKPILETGFALPTIKSLLNDPYFTENPNAKVLADAPSYGKVADLVFGGPAKKDDVLKPIGDALERIFSAGDDVKTALDQGAQEADQVLSQ